MANIPVDYWYLDMDNFSGEKILLQSYHSIADDINKSYNNGVSYCFAGGHGTGKQLSLETELPTPLGFIKLKDLKCGDRLFDENGNICKVTMLHKIQISPESYEVIFDDNSKVKACADHLWLTYTRKDRRDKLLPKIKTTKEIFKTLKAGGVQKISNHSIPCAKPLNYSKQKLPIDPYVLGCWLGDGTKQDGSIESADKEILDNIRKTGFTINLCKSTVSKNSLSCRYRIGSLVKRDGGYGTIGELAKQLKRLKLIKNKHIPDIYMHSSYEQRLALLQGLLDTDGTCSKQGRIEITSSIPKLAKDIHQLILSFGIKVTLRRRKSFLYGKRCKDRYRMAFTTQLPVFKFKKKKNRIRLNKTQLSRTTHRFIIDVRKTESEPMRCITVDSPSNLFLITRSLIPTHNTYISTNILKRAVEKGYSALYTNLTDIVTILTSYNHEEKRDTRQALLTVDFLVIDEFDPRFMGSDNASDLYGRILEPALRHRIQNKLPIFFCSNSPNVTASFHGSLKSSISSLMNMVKPVMVLGQDYRDKIKKGTK